jgi:choline kinase
MISRPIDKAIILAAGRGNRIASASAGTPKPLLPIDGRPGGPTFLDWHIHCLTALGVGEIVLVGNQATHGHALPAMAGRPVRWVLNPTTDLTTSGSAHSAAFAWPEVLDGASRVLLMDADVVYDPAVLRRLANAPGPRSKILVHPDFRDTDEEVLVFADADVPCLQGKGLLGTPMVSAMRCLGEATGLLLWEPGDHAALRAASDWVLAFSTAKARSEHEDVTNALLRAGRLDAVPCDSEDLCMEVDTPDEYATLIADVAPRLAAMLPGAWPQATSR